MSSCSECLFVLKGLILPWKLIVMMTKLYFLILSGKNRSCYTPPDLKATYILCIFPLKWGLFFFIIANFSLYYNFPLWDVDENSTFSYLFCSSEPSNFTAKSTFNLKNIAPFSIFHTQFFSFYFIIKFLKVRNPWHLDLDLVFKLGNTTCWWPPSSLSWKTSFLCLPKHIASKSFEYFYLFNYVSWHILVDFYGFIVTLPLLGGCCNPS